MLSAGDVSVKAVTSSERDWTNNVPRQPFGSHHHEAAVDVDGRAVDITHWPRAIRARWRCSKGNPFKHVAAFSGQNDKKVAHVSVHGVS
jgi:hypothetical protein